MKCQIFAIGRLKKGPELELFERYFERAQAMGKSLGVSHLKCHDYVESRVATTEQRQRQEAELLFSKMPNSKHCFIVCDEKGRNVTTHELTKIIDNARENGQDVSFCLGGADGHSDLMREKADHIISMGKMTWPHQLARVMIMEQIYRCFSLMAGHPYHRD